MEREKKSDEQKEQYGAMKKKWNVARAFVKYKFNALKKSYRGGRKRAQEMKLKRKPKCEKEFFMERTRNQRRKTRIAYAASARIGRSPQEI